MTGGTGSPPTPGGNTSSGGGTTKDAGGGGTTTTPPGGGTADAGGGTATDAGGGGGGGATNAFTGATTFAAKAPDDQSTNHHGGASHAGDNCLDCHTGTPTNFTFAGTAYLDTAGTKPAVNAEVRVVGADGKEVGLVHTDNSGNFWMADVAKIAAGSLTGARSGATPKLMVTTLGAGNCNTCHKNGGLAPVITVQ